MSAGSNAVTIVAAVVGSAPGWVGLYVANRRALGRQTREIKTHVDQRLAERAPDP
jgi:hypothetical protein